MTIDPTTSRSVRTNCDNHLNNVRRRSARSVPTAPDGAPQRSSAVALRRLSRRPARGRSSCRCCVPLAPRCPRQLPTLRLCRTRPQFLKQCIVREESTRFRATGSLPPIDPLAMGEPQSPRRAQRYWKAPQTPDSPFSQRAPMKFDKCARPYSPHPCARARQSQSARARRNLLLVTRAFHSTWSRALSAGCRSPAACSSTRGGTAPAAYPTAPTSPRPAGSSSGRAARRDGTPLSRRTTSRRTLSREA